MSTTSSSRPLVRNGYPAPQDIRGTREVQVLREGPTFQGLKTSDSDHLAGVHPDVTMLAIARDPEHQDLTCGYSGCAVRRGSACGGRPASHDLGDVSAVCTIKEAKWKPIRRS